MIRQDVQRVGKAAQLAQDRLAPEQDLTQPSALSKTLGHLHGVLPKDSLCGPHTPHFPLRVEALRKRRRCLPPPMKDLLPLHDKLCGGSLQSPRG